MATIADEATNPPNSNSNLPPYPEMILLAIKTLDDNNGSNKSAIANYIESNYDELPPSHASLLTAHLARMKESGELLLVKNNYLIAGPDAPPKRGRGRPPKPKEPLPPSSVVEPPRPRGRPPKPKDPLAMAVAKASSGLPRRRGRPPKMAARPSGAAAAAAAGGTTTAVAGVKRGRGRPPKVKPVAQEDGNE